MPQPANLLGAGAGKGGLALCRSLLVQGLRGVHPDALKKGEQQPAPIPQAMPKLRLNSVGPVSRLP